MSVVSNTSFFTMPEPLEMQMQFLWFETR